jgi:hypothetical protein
VRTRELLCGNDHGGFLGIRGGGVGWGAKQLGNSCLGVSDCFSLFFPFLSLLFCFVHLISSQPALAQYTFPVTLIIFSDIGGPTPQFCPGKQSSTWCTEPSLFFFSLSLFLDGLLGGRQSSSRESLSACGCAPHCDLRHRDHQPASKRTVGPFAFGPAWRILRIASEARCR